MMKLSEIAQIVSGRLQGDDVDIHSVSIDTRQLQPGQLYVAIQGERFDGNEFLAQAEQAGAAAAITHEGFSTTLPQVMVADTRLALAELAGAWRRLSGAKVVGITGSNGKTTVKEMTAAILAVAGETLYTQGNLNNDIGVPLTLLRMTGQHRYAVIEMGANHAREIAYTSRYAQSDVVILNNAGAAHLEGFGSLDGVARAKGEIVATLKADGVAILNRDDTYFPYWQEVAGPRRVIAFGLDEKADVTAKNFRTERVANAFRTVFDLHAPQGQATIALNLAGVHNVRNALAAAAAGLALGLPLETIAQGLSTLQPVKGRLQPRLGAQGHLIIDDTYNANPSSLAVGLEVLLACGGDPWLVLGAFGELGEDSAALHGAMGRTIKASGVKRLWATGEETRHTVAGFGDGATFFADQAALVAALRQSLADNVTILVKGSRAQHMEHVVAALVGEDNN